MLLALVRDQLAPRIGGSRELARAVGLPLIAAVPETPRRRRGGSRPASPAEHEAYQSLAASVRFALPADAGPQILFVTSTLPDEGKSTVTAELGRALARIGQRTLLVSADLRSPTLDARVGASAAPGLTDVVRRAAEPGPAVAELVSDVIVAVPDPPGGAALDLLPSGTPAEDPARLLAGPVMGAVLYALGHLDYAYVLVDVAPVLGLADTQALARHMHHVVYVARTHRLSPDAVLDARDVLDRFEVRPLGLVVLGVRGEPSPGYGRRGSGRVLEKT